MSFREPTFIESLRGISIPYEDLIPLLVGLLSSAALLRFMFAKPRGGIPEGHTEIKTHKKTPLCHYDPIEKESHDKVKGWFEKIVGDHKDVFKGNVLKGSDDKVTELSEDILGALCVALHCRPRGRAFGWSSVGDDKHRWILGLEIWLLPLCARQATKWFISSCVGHEIVHCAQDVERDFIKNESRLTRREKWGAEVQAHRLFPLAALPMLIPAIILLVIAGVSVFTLIVRNA